MIAGLAHPAVACQFEQDQTVTCFQYASRFPVRACNGQDLKPGQSPPLHSLRDCVILMILPSPVDADAHPLTFWTPLSHMHRPISPPLLSVSSDE